MDHSTSYDCYVSTRQYCFVRLQDPSRHGVVDVDVSRCRHSLTFCQTLRSYIQHDCVQDLTARFNQGLTSHQDSGGEIVSAHWCALGRVGSRSSTLTLEHGDYCDDRDQLRLSHENCLLVLHDLFVVQIAGQVKSTAHYCLFVISPLLFVLSTTFQHCHFVSHHLCCSGFHCISIILSGHYLVHYLSFLSLRPCVLHLDISAISLQQHLSPSLKENKRTSRRLTDCRGHTQGCVDYLDCHPVLHCNSHCYATMTLKQIKPRTSAVTCLHCSFHRVRLLPSPAEGPSIASIVSIAINTVIARSFMSAITVIAVGIATRDRAL